jgi:cell division protein FtsW (lipid II flippase)
MWALSLAVLAVVVASFVSYFTGEPSFQWLTVTLFALFLIGVLASPDEPRWGSRPWFVKGEPKRAYVAAFIALFLVLAIAHAVR